jgi:signal transduction histidine kinase/ActR/RegA family two-component response regulator
LTVVLPLAVVAAMTLAMGVVLALSLRAGTQTIERQALANIEAAAQSYASTVQLYVAGARGALESLAAPPTFERFSAADPVLAVTLVPALQRDLEAVQRHAGAFDHVMLLSATGEVLATAPEALQAERPEQGFGHAAWFRALQQGRVSVVSNLDLAPATRRPVVFIAVPVLTADGKVAGAVVGALLLERLSRAGLLDNGAGARLGPGWGFVTDRRGLVIAHQSSPRFIEHQTDFTPLEPVRQALAGQRSSGRFTDSIERSEVLGAWLPQADTGWAVIYQMPLEVAQAPITSLQRSFLKSIVPIVLVLALLVFFLMLRIVRPLRTLTQDVARVAAGGAPKSQPLPASKGTSEISVLTEAYNRMANDLVEKEQALRQRALAAESSSAALRDAHEALQHADRRKDLFIATLAHELRNPLAPLRNAVQLLKAGASPERCTPMLQRQIDHLVRLVDDLLEVSRISSGKIDLRRAPVPVSDIVLAAVDLSRDAVEARHHRLAVEFDGAANVCLFADSVRMTQVLSNLINNAAKYTPDGGLITLRVNEEHDQIVLSVRDTGAGIPHHMLEEVFEPFVQVDDSACRAQGGLGIGLALVRNLVKMHGGTVVARSGGAGQGSEFEVRLPRPADASEWEAAPELDRSRAPVDKGTGADADSRPMNLRVLVIDDNRDAADSLADILRCEGVEALVAYDGESGLRSVATHEPDLVLLDLGMPGMDGYAVASAIRSNGKQQPCRLVALTGWAQPDDRQRAQDAGFDTHLVKPVGIDVLLSLLREVQAAR